MIPAFFPVILFSPISSTATRDYKLITPQMGWHERRGKRIADDQKKKVTKILRYWFYKSEQINNKCDIIKYDD